MADCIRIDWRISGKARLLHRKSISLVDVPTRARDIVELSIHRAFVNPCVYLADSSDAPEYSLRVREMKKALCKDRYCLDKTRYVVMNDKR